MKYYLGLPELIVGFGVFCFIFTVVILAIAIAANLSGESLFVSHEACIEYAEKYNWKERYNFNKEEKPFWQIEAEKNGWGKKNNE